VTCVCVCMRICIFVCMCVLALGSSDLATWRPKFVKKVLFQLNQM